MRTIEELALCGKKYNIIYADPPWHVTAGPELNSGRNFPHVSNKSRKLKYPTMSVEDISKMPVKNIAHHDAHLYLWTINKYIEQSYSVARAWGFKPVVLLTWCKNPMGLGLGGAFAQTTEHLLFCRRGKLKTKTRHPSTWFLHKRGPHSKKPDFVRDLIVNISGYLPKIELFARQQARGWDAFGNEATWT